MPDQQMYDTHVAFGKTIERLAVAAFPDARTRPLAVAEYVKTPEGRKLANAASVIHRAARRT